MRFKASLLHFIVMGITAAALGVLFVPSDAAQAADGKPIQLVGFGDSLMAGYQLPPDYSYTARLEAALKEKGQAVVVSNAGVSGDTTSGGLSRIDWSVPDGTDGVIVELGANDALRGISPEQSERNLDQMIARLKERKIAVLLVGMLSPPNMGQDYQDKFNPLYKRLADKYKVPLYPFFLDGVAFVSGMQLADGLHPNEKGIDIMVAKTLPAVESFLGDIRATGK